VAAIVLVVEDDQSIRSLIARMLRSEGHQVLEASDGATALEILQGMRCDLVITDFLMPKLNWNQIRLAVSFPSTKNAHNIDNGLSIRRVRYDNHRQSGRGSCEAFRSYCATVNRSPHARANSG